MKRMREYLQFLNKSISAIESAVDSFNRVYNPYKNETTLILITNGWELLAKAVLLKTHQKILKDKEGNTISAEVAISKLRQRKHIEDNQEKTIQQIISLRNSATHQVLPNIPIEIMHHLLFYSCKFFREIVSKIFPSHAKRLQENYLSLSFSELTTYANRVQKLVSGVKKSPHDKQLVWLLERGICFDGTKYINQKEFENKYKGKLKIMPHLSMGDYIKDTDMVKIVPIQAPKNFTADISLRKGSHKDSSLPAFTKRTNIETDYPYLTSEIASRIGKNTNFTQKTIAFLGFKGNDKYHHSVRTSIKASNPNYVHRYSEAALEKIKEHLKIYPEFDPYRPN
jgi:Domain of unknown function (DUF3644)